MLALLSARRPDWTEAVLLGPETWIVLAAGAVSAAIAAAIAWLVRKREFEPEDITIGFLGPSLAAMYLVVLAIALATEWQTIGSAQQQAAGNEAVAVRQLYWAASGLPPTSANQLRHQVRDYASTHGSSRSSHRDVIPCICGTDLVVARFLAAAVLRLSRSPALSEPVKGSASIDISYYPPDPGNSAARNPASTITAWCW